MRYSGDIITAIRNRTGNKSFTLGTDTSVIEDVQEGIGDQTILEFLNEAQAQLQAAIINTHPVEFVVSKVIDVVANQEEYDPEDNLFINNRYLNMQYSRDGQARNYEDLQQVSIEHRNTDTATHPLGWIRRSGKILLTPIPTATGAKLRPEYYRQLDAVQLRAGVIDGVTESAGAISANTLSISITGDLVGLIDNVTDKYLCIVDKDGNVIEYNIPYTSYDDATGNFTHAAHTRTGTTAINTSGGHFITVGKYTTTHSALPNHCEHFLKEYAQMKVLAMDSNVDIQEEFVTLQAIQQGIVDSFGDVDEDLQFFPIISSEY